MRERMTLMEFMDVLRDEGVLGEEYEDRVAEFIARRKAQEGRTAIVRRDRSDIARPQQEMMIPFPTSAQDHGLRTTRARIPVDYGDESTAEAEERWRAQERSDPDGVLGLGGMSAGGIFGGGAIATDTYDPEARQRAAPAVTAQVQLRQLEVLERMDRRLAESEDENRLLRSREDERRLGRGGDRSRLLRGKGKR